MKKYISIILIVLLIGGVFNYRINHVSAAISAAPVQQQAIVSSGATISVTLSGTPVTGNTLIFFAGSQAADKAITFNTVTQTGVTWHQAVTSNTNRRSVIWYGEVGASPSASLTINLSGAPATTIRGGISEWSGLLTLSSLDQSTSNNGSSAAPTTGTITPTSGRNSLIIATSGNPGNASAPTNGFTALTSQDPSFPGSYLVVTSTSGTNSTAWSSTSSGLWDTEIANFLGPTGNATHTQVVVVKSQLIINKSQVIIP